MKLDKISVRQLDYARGILRGITHFRKDLQDSIAAILPHLHAAARYLEREQNKAHRAQRLLKKLENAPYTIEDYLRDARRYPHMRELFAEQLAKSWAKEAVARIKNELAKGESIKKKSRRRR